MSEAAPQATMGSTETEDARHPAVIVAHADSASWIGPCAEFVVKPRKRAHRGGQNGSTGGGGSNPRICDAAPGSS
jgi:hypothetical protein